VLWGMVAVDLRSEDHSQIHFHLKCDLISAFGFDPTTEIQEYPFGCVVIQKSPRSTYESTRRYSSVVPVFGYLSA
jgi:hypothetical protein